MTSFKFANPCTIDSVPVMIISEYVFYILVFFGEGVLNKPRNQGSFGTFRIQILSRVLIGYDFRLLLNKSFIHFPDENERFNPKLFQPTRYQVEKVEG